MAKKRLKVLPAQPVLRSEDEINKDYAEICQALVTLDMQRAGIDHHMGELRIRVIALSKEMDQVKAQATPAPATPKTDEQK